jgi:hypothetical protein
MPTREQLKKALSLIQRRSDFEYFFENLKSSDWLPHLIAEKIFERPDGPISSDGNMIRFPFWPPSRYLIQIASSRPAEVMNVILSIPETENPRIHDDFLTAALNMPPEVSAKVASSAAKWLENPYQLLFYDKISNLIVHLKKGGFTKEALKLAEATYSMRNLEDKKHKEADGLSYKKAKPLLRGDWDFGESLKIVAPAFEGESLLDFINILCWKLVDVLQIEERAQTEKFIDYSHIWRGSIEDSNQNNDFGVKDTLIDSVRDLSERLIDQSPGLSTKLIELLRSFKFPLFSRIALHLARIIGDRSLTTGLLLDSKLFDAMDTWHEYSLLLESAFPTLDSDDQKKLLEKIFSYAPYSAKEVSLPADQVEREHRRLRYQYLYMISTFLTGDDSRKFNELKADFGEVEHPTFSNYSSSWVGPTSPIDTTQMEEMGLPKLIEFLTTWKSVEKFGPVPSEEGLARDFQQYVHSHYEEIIEHIEKFKTDEMRYSSSVIDGIGAAFSEGKSINWAKVFDFLAWAADQKEIAGTIQLSWQRQSCCRLIQKVLGSDKVNLRLDSSDKIWKVVQSSLSDFDPNQAREEQFKSSRSFYDGAINSTRGVAVEAAVRIAIWLVSKANSEKFELNKTIYPELMNQLALHADPTKENSRVVHSVYGRWTPTLEFYDPSWFADNAQRIFPDDASLNEYWESAWRAYILYCPPYDNLLPNLGKHYLRALEKIKSGENDKEERVEKRLLEHLTTFYLRKKLELDSELISKLYERSDVAIRSDIIEFIGRGLSNTKKEIDPMIVEQARNLWQHRVEACKLLKKPEDRLELSEFGWWMGTKHLTEEWMLDQVIATLELCHHITADFVVMGRLVGMTNKCPAKVAKILELLVQYQVSEHGHYIFLDKAKIILEKLLKSESSGVAKDVINKLGAYGFNQFGELLN